jgi:hypothetical protein
MLRARLVRRRVQTRRPHPSRRARSTVDNGMEALERRPVVVESEEW